MPDLYDPLTYENLMAGLVSPFDQLRKAMNCPGEGSGEQSAKQTSRKLKGGNPSLEYREQFKISLAKQFPRIPAVKSFDDFAAFRNAGRALGDLHVNFESVEPYMITFKEGDHRLIHEAQSDTVTFYRIKHTKKWKWGGKSKKKDRTTVIYNDSITLKNAPLEAYKYVVNGKPALEWVMERQIVKTDRKSGIVNDANDYANETVGDPKYPLELFQRVITVSLETMKIANGLSGLEID